MKWPMLGCGYKTVEGGGERSEVIKIERSVPGNLYKMSH